MRLSKKPLSKQQSHYLLSILSGVLAETRNASEAKQILSELLTETERVAVMKRIAIATALTNRESYESMKKRLKVSSATIATIQERIDQPGWQKIIEKARVQATATQRATRIKHFFAFFIPHFS